MQRFPSSIAALVGISLFCLAVGLKPPAARGPIWASDQSFADMSGRRVSVELPARRVAMLASVASAYAAVDEGVAAILTLADTIHAFEGSGLLEQMFPRLTSLQVLKTSQGIPNLEILLFMNPDVVVAWPSQAEALRAIGRPGVITLNYTSRQSLSDIWSILARLSCQVDRANHLWADSEARTQGLFDVLPSGSRSRVLPMTLTAAGWWIGTKNYSLNALLESVRARNPADDVRFHGPTSPEEILSLAPDVILIPSHEKGIIPNEIYSNPLWQSLPAVRERRAYLVPFTSPFNSPVDQTLLLFWLAELLYPSMPLMTRAAYHDIYAEAYHFEISDDQIDHVLFMKENNASAGYGRFAGATSGDGGKLGR